ncbi:hypothetical protein PG990_000066 [Apiospora arundinis]|uniref:Uncharacterized protein n=1 Tax=Apiospora arundinis TaxID=335852 RepID=A0ABR2HZ80_9PEZI
MILPRSARCLRVLLLLILVGLVVATLLLILHRPATTYDLLYEIAAEGEKVRRQKENQIFAQRNDMKQ